MTVLAVTNSVAGGSVGLLLRFVLSCVVSLAAAGGRTEEKQKRKYLKNHKEQVTK